MPAASAAAIDAAAVEWNAAKPENRTDSNRRPPAAAAMQMSAELAAKSYDILLDPKQGFDPKAAIDLEGVRRVLTLRSEYSQPRKPLADPMKYLDLTYYDRALTP